MSKKSDTILIIGIVLIIVVFGIILFALKNPKNTVEEINYSGYVFTKYGNVWETTVNVKNKVTGANSNYNILFHYNPLEVKDIPTLRDTRNQTVTPYLFMNVKRVYITTEPDYPASVVLGGVEIAKILSNVYNKDVKGAITRSTRNTTTPIITCDNLTDTQRVIYLKLGNTTGIYSQQGCIIVQGVNEVDLLKASERLSFEMLKIL
jgi:hypothetical protein